MRPITSQCSGVPRARAAHEADGVGIIDHDERAVFVGEIADAAQIGDVAVH